jgi:hypothetical protein
MRRGGCWFRPTAAVPSVAAHECFEQVDVVRSAIAKATDRMSGVVGTDDPFAMEAIVVVGLRRSPRWTSRRKTPCSPAAFRSSAWTRRSSSPRS